MARIELRDCDVSLQDGLAGTGAVNQPDTPPEEGDTSLTLDTLVLNTANTQTVPIGARFTIAGETADTLHVVTGRTQQALGGTNEEQTVTVVGCSTTFTLGLLGRTTDAIAHDADAEAVKAALVALDDGYTSADFDVSGSEGAGWVVTFTGALAQMPMTALVVTADTGSGTVERTVHGAAPTAASITVAVTFSPALGDGTYLDGGILTFLPQRVIMKIGEGNITYTEHNEYEYLKDRGNLDSVKEGDEVPMDVKLEAVFEHITTGTGEHISPIDALKGIGGAVEWVSASADLCEPYCIDVVVEHTPPCGTSQLERVTFPDFRSEQREINYKDATISVDGKCKATEPIVERE